MSRESRPPEGKTTLSWKCHETDYHSDYEVATLEPDGDKLLLVIENSNVPLKGSRRDSGTYRYSITPSSLIDLIKQHGEKV